MSSASTPCQSDCRPLAGSNAPSILPLEQQRALAEVSVASVLALGFKSGIFHVEGKFTSTHGAQLIEVSCALFFSSHPLQSVAKGAAGLPPQPFQG